MKYNKTLLWKILRIFKLAVVFPTIYLKRWTLIASIHFCPKYVYLFSHLKRLPPPSHRIEKTNNPLDDFHIFEDPVSSKISLEEKVNIVMRGCSFDQKQLDEFLDITFLVNWPDKVEHSNVVYTTADQNDLLAMFKKEMTPLLFVHELHYENGEIRGNNLLPGIEGHIRSGAIKRVFLEHKCNIANSAISSALAAIVALSKYSHQIDIYGFDQYQTNDLGEKTHWEALFALQKFAWGGPNLANFPAFIPHVSDIPERGIYCWHYANRFHEIPWIRNHGFLGNIDKHQRIVKSFDQIFYN